MVQTRRMNIVTVPASSALCAKVNEEVTRAHNLNGWDAEPPFREDRTSGIPTPHYDPRDVSLFLSGLYQPTDWTNAGSQTA
jgi:hypothetical protein